MLFRSGAVEAAASGEAALVAQRRSPAALAAADAEASGQAVVDRVLRARLPGALFNATQVVALGIYSAELDGVYEAPPRRKGAPRKRARALKPGVLEFFYPKSGARLTLQVYDERGRMRPEALWRFSRALYAPGEEPMLGDNPWVAQHPRLLAMLTLAAHQYDKPLEIVSAFRPSGGGSDSNHGKGLAIDFRVIGVNRQHLLGWLDQSFTNAGIGWYPNSPFIHLDVRDRPYHWVDRSRPGQRQRTRERKVKRAPRPSADPTARTVHLSPDLL